MRRSFRPLVLCYHRVSSAEPHRLAVSAEQVDAHIGSLVQRGYRPASAEELLTSRDQVFHVTFDDAFRSIVNALPALERLRVPVTVFVCTEPAEDGRPLSIPELEQVVDDAPTEFATLRWDELRELADRGVEIGSHTVSHAHLPRLGAAELDRELRESRERIADELRRPCRYFAYPYGEHDERVREAVRRTGYEAAFALDVNGASVDPFALPRADLYWGDVLSLTR